MRLIHRVTMIVSTAVAGVSLILTALMFAKGYGFALTEVTVPNDGDPSVTADAEGVLHFSHSVRYGDDMGLYCTSIDGGKRETVRVSDTQKVASTSIAADSDAHLHIAYTHDFDLSNYNLHGYVSYATNASGVWQTYIVTSGPGIYRQCSLAVTSEGIARIAFVQNSTLKVASASQEKKTEFDIESVTDGVYECNLAVDPEGVPHTSYVKDGVVFVATRSSNGSWTTEVVMHGNSTSDCTALAFDKSGWGRAVFSSAVGGVGGLWFANESEGSWNCTRILEVNDSGNTFCSLALDSNDVANVAASFDDTLAFYSRETNGSWINWHLLGVKGGPPASIDICLSQEGDVCLALGSFYGEIAYMDTSAGVWKAASQLPYIMSIGTLFVAVAAILTILEVFKHVRNKHQNREFSQQVGPTRRKNSQQ